MDKKIKLRVNGKKHELEVPTNRLLIDCLRYDLGFDWHQGGMQCRCLRRLHGADGWMK